MVKNMGKTREEPYGEGPDHQESNPFGKTCSKISWPFISRDVPPLLLPEGQDIIRLALISLPSIAATEKRCCILGLGLSGIDHDSCAIKLNSHADRKNQCIKEKRVFDIDHGACVRKLAKYSAQKAGELFEYYKAWLLMALEEFKANIVCINELGFPSHNCLPLPAARKFTRELANKYHSLIIAGSYHDRRTAYNTGHIYYPGCGPYGKAFHKQVSATKLTKPEFVSVPSERLSLSVEAFGLKICIVICLDMMDFSTAASIVQSGDLIDFLLVPAYSDDIEPIEKVAYSISRALPGGVAIVNHHRPGKYSSSLYLFDNKNPKKTKTEDISNDGGQLTVHEINSKWFLGERRDRKDRVEGELVWLYGRPQPERR